MVFLLAFYILLKPAIPVIDFIINYGYIITELCVNRNRPEMQCNGKCYLKKELANTSENQNPISKERKIPLPGNDVFFKNLQERLKEVAVFPVKRNLPVFHETMIPLEQVQPVFHPPTLLS